MADGCVIQDLKGMRFVGTPTYPVSIQREFTTVSGKIYEFKMGISDVLSGQVRLSIKRVVAGTYILSPTTFTSWSGTYRFTADVTSIEIIVETDTVNNTDYVINDWSLREVTKRPGNIKLYDSLGFQRTITGVRISVAPGYTFADNCSELGKFANKGVVTFVDINGKKLTASIKGKGVVETFSEEKIINGGMENWTTDTILDNWNKALEGSSIVTKESVIVNSGSYATKCTVVSGAGVHISQNIAFNPNALYKHSFWYKNNGGMKVYSCTNDEVLASAIKYSNISNTLVYTNKSGYGTASVNDNAVVFRRTAITGNYEFYIDEASIKQVLTPSASGLYLDNLVMESGFVLNQASYIVQVTLNNQEFQHTITPLFNSSDITSDTGIISINTTQPLVSYTPYGIKVSDGTNLSIVEDTFVDGVDKTIGLVYNNNQLQAISDNKTAIVEKFKNTLSPGAVIGIGASPLPMAHAGFSLKRGVGVKAVTETKQHFFDVISSQTVSGVVQTTSGQSITIYWGDGTSNTYTGTTDQAYSKDYGSVGNRTVTIVNKSVLTKFTMATSGTNIKLDLSSLPSVMTYFSCSGTNTITGNLSSIPSGMTSFYCSGTNTITGNLSSLPSVMTSFFCGGSNTITGDLSSLPSVMTYLRVEGSNTITGNLSSLPSVMTYFLCTGSNTITGNLSSIPSAMTYFYCTGSNTISDYTTKTWPNNMQRVYCNPTGVGGLSSAEVDQLLIDLAAAGGTWSGDKQVYLKGTNAIRTAASDAAVATLVGKGVSVTTT